MDYGCQCCNNLSEKEILMKDFHKPWLKKAYLPLHTVIHHGLQMVTAVGKVTVHGWAWFEVFCDIHCIGEDVQLGSDVAD